MIDKNLAFMADARTAGVVVGAHVPIVLTSRGAEGAAARLLASGLPETAE
jgi:phosphate acetyltransferase